MIKLPFAILNPVHQPARLDLITHLGCVEDLSVLDEIVNGWDGHTPMAFDFETRGDVHLPDSRVVTIAISDNRGTVTIDFRGGNPHAYPYLFQLLVNAKVPLLAHNAYFDAAWILRDLMVDNTGGVSDVYFNPKYSERYGVDPKECFSFDGRVTPLWIPVVCTFATYRHLANEGWIGQQYGLGKAQIDLLNWEESNKDDVARWLSVNGFRKSNLAKRIDEALKAGEELDEEDERSLLRVADKGNLWQVPYDVLGPYNALDADSTWLIWTYVLSPALSRFDALKKWMTTTYPAFTRLLVEQKLRGIQLDMEFLPAYRNALEIKKNSLVSAFLAQPEVAPFVVEWNETVVAAYKAKEPAMFTKNTELPQMPKKHTTKGSVTSNWLKWDAKRRELEAKGRPLSKNWIDWRRKLDELETSPSFDLNKDSHSEWLFYEKLALPVLMRTETGKPGLSVDALRHAPGAKLLEQWSSINKELTTVESLLEIQIDGVYNPSVKTPGTFTGRLSGAGGFNCQNVSKSPLLYAFRSRPGYKVIVTDIVALENMVATELSQDPVMVSLYGPDANPNQDSHLYNGSKLPVIGDAIRATGYDPDDPTKDIVAYAKKAAKASRDIAKTCGYALIYGAGAGRLQAQLEIDGIDVPLEQCQEIRDGWWVLYDGLKGYYQQLRREWTKNKGWFLGGMGRPMCVDKESLKDLGSRQVQGTGHDTFILLCLKVKEVLDREGVEWYPWNMDIHDAFMIEVRDEDVQRTIDLHEVIVAEWNEELGGTIRLKADPNAITTWAEDKLEKDKLPKIHETYGIVDDLLDYVQCGG